MNRTNSTPLETSRPQSISSAGWINSPEPRHNSRTWMSFLCGLACVLLFLSGEMCRAQYYSVDVPGFERGDCNQDSNYDLGDATLLLGYLFSPSISTLDCEQACDFGDDGNLDLLDPISMLTYLFNGGPAPAAPFANCGIQQTATNLECAIPPCLVATTTSTKIFTLPSAFKDQDYQGFLPDRLQTEFTSGSYIIQPGIYFVNYGLVEGESLPQGLTLNGQSGEVSGLPTQEGHFDFLCWGELDTGEFARIAVSLSIFLQDQSDVDASQDFSQLGPYGISEYSSSFSYAHQYYSTTPYPQFLCSNNNSNFVANRNHSYRVYYPSNLGSAAAPILFFHHGTGFSYLNYTDILEHFCSHGVICVTVEDSYSYTTYGPAYCWGGHLEGARILIALKEDIASKTADSGHTLFEKINWDRIFYGGHSRGGASALSAADFDPMTCGVISLQATDAKRDSWIGNTNMWDVMSEVPVLNVSVEQDFDVIFPIAERIFERLVGYTSMVTIYGGCHGYTSDTNSAGCNTCTWNAGSGVDQCRYISRSLQLSITKQFGASFLHRHAFGDQSIEPILYSDDSANGALYSKTYNRKAARKLMVDDFSAAPLNSLGLATTFTGGSSAIGACYDLSIPISPAPAVTNFVMTLANSADANYNSALGTMSEGLDVSEQNKLSFRIKNRDRYGFVDNFGFDWLDIEVTLTDTNSESATIDFTPMLPSIAQHPQPFPGGATVTMKYQRFLTLSATLDQFVSENPQLDISSLLSLDIRFVTGGSSLTPIFAMDDLLFE